MTNIIGENIKILRERMGLSQTNIAQFLNVGQSLISKVEKGERNISSDMLEKIACLFGVTVEDIENGKIEASNLSFAFRAISAINRIALNTEFMGGLLKEVNT